MSFRGRVGTGLLSVLCGLVLTSSAVWADSPGSRLLLLQGDAVREKLQLTSAQTVTLQRLLAEYRREIVPFLERGDEQAWVMLQASTAAFNRRATDVLSTTQRERLLQIEHRILGPWMLHTPSVQDELHLTPAQRARIAAIGQRVEQLNQRLLQRVEQGRLTPAARLHRLRTERERQNRALLRVLTTEQRHALAEMAGT